MRYKNPTPNPLPASDEGAKMYLIRAETVVKKGLEDIATGNTQSLNQFIEEMHQKHGISG